MKNFHTTGGAFVDDTPLDLEITDNVGEAASPGTPFKADWIEVVNDGPEVLLANPFHSFSNPAAAGVVINEGEVYRFEYDQTEVNPQVDQLVGYTHIYLLSTNTGTSARVTAGAR